jgi:hypothetical protein
LGAKRLAYSYQVPLAKGIKEGVNNGFITYVRIQALHFLLTNDGCKWLFSVGLLSICFERLLPTAKSKSWADEGDFALDAKVRNERPNRPD